VIDFITSRGYAIDYTSDRCPKGFIEFRHKRDPGKTFWRLTLREAYEELGGP
jgi:hypothetical protein